MGVRAKQVKGGRAARSEGPSPSTSARDTLPLPCSPYRDTSPDGRARRPSTVRQPPVAEPKRTSMAGRSWSTAARACDHGIQSAVRARCAPNVYSHVCGRARLSPAPNVRAAKTKRKSRHASRPRNHCPPDAIARGVSVCAWPAARAIETPRWECSRQRSIARSGARDRT
jgi:hypothetical protein